MGNGNSRDDLAVDGSTSPRPEIDSHLDNPILSKEEELEQQLRQSSSDVSSPSKISGSIQGSPTPTPNPNPSIITSTTASSSKFHNTKKTEDGGDDDKSPSKGINQGATVNPTTAATAAKSPSTKMATSPVAATAVATTTCTATMTTITCIPNSRRKRIDTTESNKSASSLSTMTKSIGSGFSNKHSSNQSRKTRNAISESQNKYYPSTSFYSSKHTRSSSSSIYKRSNTDKNSKSKPTTTSSHLEAVLLRRKRKAQLQNQTKKNNITADKRNLYAHARNQDTETFMMSMKNTPAGIVDGRKKPSADTSLASPKKDDADVYKDEAKNMNSNNDNAEKEKNRFKQHSNTSSIFSILTGAIGQKNDTNTDEEVNKTNINVKPHPDISYDDDNDDNQSSLTSNVSLNTSTQSTSSQTHRSLTADVKARKKAIKEDEVRHRIQRLGKSDKKASRESAMRDKLNQLAISNSHPNNEQGGVASSDMLAATGGYGNDQAVGTGFGSTATSGASTGRSLSYYNNINDADDEEEKQEITKDSSPYEVRRVYDSVLAESNISNGVGADSGKRTFIRQISETFESLLPPNEVDVKNPGKFPDKPNSTPTSPELLEQNMYSSFMDGGQQVERTSAVGGKDDNVDQQSDVSSVSQFFEEDQLL